MKWRVEKIPCSLWNQESDKEAINFQNYGKEKRSKTGIPPRSSPHGLLRVTRTSHIFNFLLIMRGLRALHHSEKQTTPLAITISCLMLPESAEGKLWLEPQVLVNRKLLKCTEIMFWFAQALLLLHFKQIMALLSDTFEAKRRRRKETSFCKSPPPQHFHPWGVVSAEQLGHRDALAHRATPPCPNIPTLPWEVMGTD